MFIYSKFSNSKTYHIEQCSYGKRIKKENAGYFYSEIEALDNNYHLCLFCSNLGKRYRKEQDAINAFCKKMKFICRWENGHIYIKTPIESWLIVYFPPLKKNVIYHKNHSLVKTSSATTDPYEKIPGYHRQKWIFRSILDTLQSIYDHQQIYLDRPDLPSGVKYHINSAPSNTKRKKT